VPGELWQYGPVQWRLKMGSMSTQKCMQGVELPGGQLVSDPRAVIPVPWTDRANIWVAISVALSIARTPSVVAVA
jgi:hypothetical protein